MEIARVVLDASSAMRKRIYGPLYFNNAFFGVMANVLMSIAMFALVSYDLYGKPVGVLHNIENYFWPFMFWLAFQPLNWYMINSEAATKQLKKVGVDPLHHNAFYVSLLVTAALISLSWASTSWTSVYMHENNLRTGLDMRNESGISTKSGVEIYALTFWNSNLQFLRLCMIVIAGFSINAIVANGKPTLQYPRLSVATGASVNTGSYKQRD